MVLCRSHVQQSSLLVKDKPAPTAAHDASGRCVENFDETINAAKALGDNSV